MLLGLASPSTDDPTEGSTDDPTEGRTTDMNTNVGTSSGEPDMDACVVCAALEASGALMPSSRLDAASGAAEMLALMHKVGANAIALHDEEQTDGDQRVAGEQGGEQAGEQGGDDTTSAWALFPALSMLNHSCAPNVEWRFNTAGDGRATVCVRTLRALEAGEELTVSYLPPRLLEPGRDGERKAKLRDGFGFVCACSRCI